jgi:hypothetical protein
MQRKLLSKLCLTLIFLSLNIKVYFLQEGHAQEQIAFPRFPLSIVLYLVHIPLIYTDVELVVYTLCIINEVYIQYKLCLIVTSQDSYVNNV